MNQRQQARIATVQLDFTPAAVAPTSRLWMPSEPLFGTDPIPSTGWDPKFSVARLAEDDQEFFATLEERLTRAWFDNLRRKIQQICGYLRLTQVDLALFPEYSLTPRLIETLVGYADQMTIAAGVGFVREADARYFEQAGLDPPPVGSNAAIVVGPNVRSVCTKQHLAEREIAEPGAGAVDFTVQVRDRTLHVGLAICLDYLHVGHTFSSVADDLDVVLVPALSRTVDDFRPKKGRDFARVIANHAAYGGSGIYVPGLSGIAFYDSEGSIPLAQHEEAIQVVDLDRPALRRTSTRATGNRLVRRAAITYKAAADANIEIAQGLGRLRGDDLNPDQLDRLTDWAGRLASRPRGSAVLLEAVKELHSQARRGVATSDAIDLCVSHAILTEVQPEAVMRSSQASTVADRIWVRLQEVSDPRDLGAAFGLYRFAGLREESGGTPSSVKTPAAVASTDALGTAQALFAVSLGSFESENAVRTLPSQLTLLRSFADRTDERIALIYRLRTTDHPTTHQTVSVFEILCAAHDLGPDELEEVRTTLEGYLRTVFVDAWSLGGTERTLDFAPTWRVQIEPTNDDDSVSIPIKEDWSSLVDQFRRLDAHVCLEMILRPCPKASPDGEPQSTEHAPPVRDPDSGTTDYERVAQNYFTEVTRHSKDSPIMELTILLSGQGDRSRWIANATARELLGSCPYRLVERPPLHPFSEAGELPEGTLLRPEEALRIFHPPYGHIQGRGLRSRRRTRIAVEDVEFPASGLSLGRATRFTSREDEDVDVVLDDDARLRHLYIVGKTGSGKTNLLKHLVRQDLAARRGFAVIDPHGDLVEYALSHSSGREDDVLLLDFGQREYLPVLNPLELDCHSPGDVDLAIEELIEIIVRRVKADYTGPVFEDTLRMVLESMTQPAFRKVAPPSILFAGRILRSHDARVWMRGLYKGDDLAERWASFEGLKSEERNETIRWVLAKFTELSRESVLRGVLGGPASSLSIEQAVNDRKVLLVSLPESAIGARAVSLLGSLIFARIRRVMFDRRRAISAQGAPPFFLYVDEFQKFVGGGFEELVAEARKFGLGLTIAHQNLRQLEAFSRFEDRPTDALLENLLGNVGNVVTMRTAPRDGGRLSTELDVPEEAVRGIGQFDAIARAVVAHEETSAFTLVNSDADGEPGLPRVRDEIRQRMIDGGVWGQADELESTYERGIERLQAKWNPAERFARRERFVVPSLGEDDALEPRNRGRSRWHPLRRD